MGRSYAGVLGPLVFTTVLFRAVLSGSSLSSTLPFACVCLFLFAALGWIVGNIASWITTEAVRIRVNTQLEEAETEGEGEAAPAAR